MPYLLRLLAAAGLLVALLAFSSAQTRSIISNLTNSTIGMNALSWAGPLRILR